MSERRYVQILPTAAFGDAIGNDAIAIYHLLQGNGYSTEIYAQNIDPRYQLKQIKPISELEQLCEKDVILYHGSTGTELNYRLQDYPGVKILIYHNITPAYFFENYSEQLYNLTNDGYEGIKYLSKHVDYCIADSAFNAKELKEMGYQCQIEVCPILIPFHDYASQSSGMEEELRKDNWTNILFVGRIAPNKKQEDIIKAFYCYQRKYKPKSRLFLVGNSSGMEKYDARLRKYSDLLGIQDKVIFTGHVSFSDILAYYKSADIFVCMSEHEGFCVPLVEAMMFEKPIIAYDAGAVSETMGNGGLLLEEKDPELTARVMHQLVQDKDLQRKILSEQKKQLDRYKNENVGRLFLHILNRAANVS